MAWPLAPSFLHTEKNVINVDVVVAVAVVAAVDVDGEVDVVAALAHFLLWLLFTFFSDWSKTFRKKMKLNEKI